MKKRKTKRIENNFLLISEFCLKSLICNYLQQFSLRKKLLSSEFFLSSSESQRNYSRTPFLSTSFTFTNFCNVVYAK